MKSIVFLASVLLTACGAATASELPVAVTPTPAPTKVCVMGWECLPELATPIPASAIEAPTAVPASPQIYTPAPLAGPVCSKGKRCGNSCISKDKVCHK